MNTWLPAFGLSHRFFSFKKERRQKLTGYSVSLADVQNPPLAIVERFMACISVHCILVFKVCGTFVRSGKQPTVMFHHKTSLDMSRKLLLIFAFKWEVNSGLLGQSPPSVETPHPTLSVLPYYIMYITLHRLFNWRTVLQGQQSLYAVDMFVELICNSHICALREHKSKLI